MQVFLEWILESSLLVIMILGIRKIFMGRIRYSAICVLWLVVMLRFMIPVNLIPLPVNIGRMISEAVSSQMSAKGYIENVGNVYTGGEDASADTEDSVSDISLAGIFAENGEKYTAAFGENSILNPENINRKSYVKSCWLAGTVVLFIIFCVSNAHKLGKIKKERRLYGSRGRIKIYTAENLKNPCLYGFLKPAVYIPHMYVSDTGKGKVSEDELEQIIMHEYIHYIHKDHILAVVRMVLASVHWFNPFMWIAVSFSKRDSELSCDETVVSLIGEENRFSYGEMLVRLAGDARWTDFCYSMVSMSKRGKEMEKRIRAISDKRQYTAWLLIPMMVIVSAAVIITCSTGMGAAAAGEQNDISYFESGSKDENVEKQSNDEQYQNVYNDTFTEDTDETLYASTYEEAFKNYIEVFTEAVNTGNTDKMSEVLKVGTEVYEQQTGIAENYHKRGIREEIKLYMFTSIESVNENEVNIKSKEKIKVYYADETDRIVKQKYEYTCEKINGYWIITGMSEI